MIKRECKAPQIRCVSTMACIPRSCHLAWSRSKVLAIATILSGPGRRPKLSWTEALRFYKPWPFHDPKPQLSTAPFECTVILDVSTYPASLSALARTFVTVNRMEPL